MIRAWPILGRDREFGLAKRLDDLAWGGVVITGAAGVGKSEVARELLRVADDAGLPTARVTGFPGATDLPFAAMAHLLPDDLGRLDGPGGDTALTGLFLLAEQALRSLAGGRRLVVMVDDADQVDLRSQALLASAVASRTAVVLATLRTGTHAPPIEQLVRTGDLQLLTLEPLDRKVSESILRQALGGTIDPATVRQLHDLSVGNPLVLRELLEGAVSSGTLVRRGDVWTLDGALSVTARLTDIVDDRLAPCTVDERVLMEVLAVAGEVPSAIAVELATEAAIDGLLARDLAIEREDGRRLVLRSAHPAYDEVLRSAMSPRRVRELRRRLADAIDRHGARRREDRLRVALWRLDSGGTVDPTGLLHAARLALADGALAVAERLVDAADEARTTVEGARIRAELAFIRGDADEVERICVDLLDGDLTEHERVAITRRRVQNLFFGLGSPVALSANAESRRRITDPALCAAIDAHQATMEVVAGRPADALALAEPLLDSPDVRTRVEASLAASLVHAVSGRADRAIEATDRALSDLAQIGPVLGMLGPGSLVFNRVVALAAKGRSDEAIAYGDAAIAGGVVDSAPSTGPLVELAVIRALVQTGRFRAAAARADRERERSATLGLASQERWAAALYVMARSALGELDGVAAMIDRIGDLEAAVPGRGLFHFDIDRARSWWAAANGLLSDARDLATAQVERCDRMGIAIGVTAGLIDLARFGDADRAVEWSRDLGAGKDQPLFLAAHRAVAAAAGDDPLELERMAEQFGIAGARLIAAEWWTLAAAAHRSRGDSRAVARCAVAAAGFADPGLDGDESIPYRTPILLTVEAGAPEPLTEREREVALLAARGRTSREIATDLFVSVRTVDHHLQRVYDKLGVRSRRDLADALGLTD